MKWEKGDPVIFQQYNTQYDYNNTVKYHCIPHELIMPLVVVNSLPSWKLRLIQANRCPVMTKLQHHAINAVQNANAEKNVCTLMLLINLAEPQLVSVSCSLTLLPIVICFMDKRNGDKDMSYFAYTCKTEGKMEFPA